MLPRVLVYSPHLPSTSILHLSVIIFLIFLPILAIAQSEIELNSRTVKPSDDTTQEFVNSMRAAARKTQHGLATFSRHLTRGDRQSLAKLGIHVLEPYQKTTYWVSVEKRANLRAIQKRLMLNMQLVSLNDEDRVNPFIWQGNFDRYLLPRESQSINFVQNSDGTLNLTVQFHLDVSEGDAKTVLNRHVVTLRKISDDLWLVVIPNSNVRALASEDLVQLIDAGPAPTIGHNDNVSARINVDLAQSLNIGTAQLGGLGGDGVQIGIFDSGIDESHQDFDNRVTPRNTTLGISNKKSSHGTQMAGTVAGNGKRSNAPNSIAPDINGTAFQWRGMAPHAELLDAPSDDGNDPATHLKLITSYGMDLANHSYGFERYEEGQYSASDRTLDGIIWGSVNSLTNDLKLFVIPQKLNIFSAGNLGNPCRSAGGSPILCGNFPYQSGYFSLARQLKNGLMVGAWNHAPTSPVPGTETPANELDKIWVGSSLGPAHDGRIKPDVVAPGANVWSPTYLAANPTGPPYYGWAAGTSDSAAAVTGSLALVLQQWATSYPDDLPLPSTLRAVMIHTAEDIMTEAPDCGYFCNGDGPVKPTPGPDLVTGWGLIKVKKDNPADPNERDAAIEIVQNHHLVQDRTGVNECEVRTYAFSAGVTRPIRITLAWDDPPAGITIPDGLGSSIPYRAPRLRNDLDLVLIDPSGQHTYYPWKLDQEIRDPATGMILTDPQQHCGRDVDVVRHFLPAPFPDQAQDTIPTGGIPVAVPGRDHLNNVEMVEISAQKLQDDNIQPGTWKAQVIGFNLTSGPQLFSLVGDEFLDLTISPDFLCKVHRLICRGMATDLICVRYGWVCQTKIEFASKSRPTKITFENPKEKILIPLTKLCLFGLDCPPCHAERRCADFTVDVQTGNTALIMEIYSSSGNLVKQDTSTKRQKRLAFKARPNEDYVLALGPGKRTKMKEQHEVTLRLSSK